MDFAFSDTQAAIRELAGRICEEGVEATGLARYDEFHDLRFDAGLWQTLCDAGLPGVAVSEELGGSGQGLVELCLLLEAVGHSLAPVPALAHTVTGLLPLQRYATPALQAAILPAACRGERLFTGAFWQAADAPPTSLQAELQDGEIRLSGSYPALPWAAQADHLLLPVRLQGELAVVLLDRDSPGLTLTPLQLTHFEPQAALALEGVALPLERVVCREEAHALWDWVRLRLRAGLCVQQLGAAERVLRMSAGYTSERHQFGVPVATFQAVGHRLADAFIDVECLRLTSWQAISRLAAGENAELETRMAAVVAADTGHGLSYAAQHVHGGTGIDRDYPLWRYCQWLRYQEMVLGGAGQQLEIIGRGLARGEGLFT